MCSSNQCDIRLNVCRMEQFHRLNYSSGNLRPSWSSVRGARMKLTQQFARPPMHDVGAVQLVEQDLIELIARIEALRHLPDTGATILRVGPLELDLIERTAKRGDRIIDLRPREYRLLEYMMRRRDQILTRALILKEVWN